MCNWLKNIVLKTNIREQYLGNPSKDRQRLVDTVVLISAPDSSKAVELRKSG